MTPDELAEFAITEAAERRATAAEYRELADDSVPVMARTWRHLADAEEAQAVRLDNIAADPETHLRQLDEEGATG